MAGRGFLPSLNFIFFSLFLFFGCLFAILREKFALRAEVIGLTRLFSEIPNIHGEDFQIISHTAGCEDLHHHVPSGLLFGVSEPDVLSREKWFPPLAVFNEPDSVGQGNIFVMDPQTKSLQNLQMSAFSGPFITHGIDIYSPPNDNESVYIFAVNHLPNPEYSFLFDGPKARSQIEVFHHKIGSHKAIHLRTIRHPLIRTPNDIYVEHERSFFVTNDHLRRAGPRRWIEDVVTSAAWSDIIHVEVLDLNPCDASANIKATRAVGYVHNPNGLGHGKNSSEILLGRATAGVMVIMQASDKHQLDLLESIQFPTCIDNPTYFNDPYVKETGRDASGYILAGMTKAITVPSGNDPVSVWWVGKDICKKKLIFQDNGDSISTASTAVVVAIDPTENEKRKQAWLFVVGPMAKGMASMKIDL